MFFLIFGVAVNLTVMVEIILPIHRLNILKLDLIPRLILRGVMHSGKMRPYVPNNYSPYLRSRKKMDAPCSWR
jgi:hypothetical protein